MEAAARRRPLMLFEKSAQSTAGFPMLTVTQ